MVLRLVVVGSMSSFIYCLSLGFTLNLQKSLHNQGVLEQGRILLVVMDDSDIVPASPMKNQLIRKDSASASMEVVIYLFIIYLFIYLFNYSVKQGAGSPLL